MDKKLSEQASKQASSKQASGGEKPLLSCSGVWKVYGAQEASLKRKLKHKLKHKLKLSAVSAEKTRDKKDTKNAEKTAEKTHGIKSRGKDFMGKDFMPELDAAVRDASLDLYRGEILVVMGLSGSGKSTLVRCLSRLIEPSCGSVTFQGRDFLAASKKETINIRRHKMGMVFQHFALLPHRTVLENVAFPLEMQGLPREQRNKNAREIVELVGLSGREDHYPRALSGGQQQRVGIARSLVVKPELWFLDEPFSALDPLIRREMQDEFLDLQSRLKKSILFVTHDFDEAIRLADRIVLMNEGRIEQTDTPEEIVLAPKTKYVREFTQSVAREKVITVRRIMSAPEANADKANAIAQGIFQGEVLATVAAQVLASDKPCAVLDENKRVVGSLARKALIKVMFQ